MKKFIRNIDGLKDYTGRETRSEEIGYGEKAVMFNPSNSDNLDDFLENAEIGTYYEHKDKTLFKVRMSTNDADVVYVDEDDDILQF